MSSRASGTLTASLLPGRRSPMPGSSSSSCSRPMPWLGTGGRRSGADSPGGGTTPRLSRHCRGGGRGRPRSGHGPRPQVATERTRGSATIGSHRGGGGAPTPGGRLVGCRPPPGHISRGALLLRAAPPRRPAIPPRLRPVAGLSGAPDPAAKLTVPQGAPRSKSARLEHIHLRSSMGVILNSCRRRRYTFSFW